MGSSIIPVMNYLHDIVAELFCIRDDHNWNCRLFNTRPLNFTHPLYALIS